MTALRRSKGSTHHAAIALLGAAMGVLALERVQGRTPNVARGDTGTIIDHADVRRVKPLDQPHRGLAVGGTLLLCVGSRRRSSSFWA